MKYSQQFVVLLSFIALAALNLPNALFAQKVGDRLRVSLENRGTMIGTVTSRNADGFELKLSGSDNQTRSILYNNVQLLERSLGKRTYKKRGFLIGAGIGAIAGVIIGKASADVCSETTTVSDAFTITIDDGCEEFGALAGILGTAVYGTGLSLTGLIIGSLVKGEGWETLPNPSMSTRFQIAPMIDVASVGGKARTILGARIRF